MYLKIQQKLLEFICYICYLIYLGVIIQNTDFKRICIELLLGGCT